MHVVQSSPVVRHQRICSATSARAMLGLLWHGRAGSGTQVPAALLTGSSESAVSDMLRGKHVGCQQHAS